MLPLDHSGRLLSFLTLIYRQGNPSPAKKTTFPRSPSGDLDIIVFTLSFHWPIFTIFLNLGLPERGKSLVSFSRVEQFEP